jgi:hypothetical protein
MTGAVCAPRGGSIVPELTTFYLGSLVVTIVVTVLLWELPPDSRPGDVEAVRRAVNTLGGPAIFLPVLAALKIHPVWYGILLTINLELALITPPVGMNLFALKAITRAPILEIIRGVAPYVLLLIGGLVLVMLFPSIALWLPGTMNFR